MHSIKTIIKEATAAKINKMFSANHLTLYCYYSHINKQYSHRSFVESGTWNL